MFVYLKEYDEKACINFQKWYFNVHLVCGYTADKEFPGEVMEVDKLQRCLNMCLLEQPKIYIKDRNLYDGIVWAGMLSGAYTAFRGNLEIFSELRALASKITIK